SASPSCSWRCGSAGSSSHESQTSDRKIPGEDLNRQEAKRPVGSDAVGFTAENAKNAETEAARLSWGGSYQIGRCGITFWLHTEPRKFGLLPIGFLASWRFNHLIFGEARDQSYVSAYNTRSDTRSAGTVTRAPTRTNCRTLTSRP